MNTTTAEAGNFTQEYYYEDEWELKPFVKESFFIALGWQWINAMLIISLNTAVIVTIVRYKKKSRLYFLLMNMAIADLITGIVDASVNATERTLGMGVLNYWWFGGNFLCKLQRTFSNISLLSSNFILAVTSIDRALVVAKPMLHFKRGNTLQKILILSCWLLSSLLSCPMLMIYKQGYYDLLTPEGGVQNVPLCRETITGIGSWKIFFYLLLIFSVLIPLTVIIISYTILVLAIYKRARSPPNSVRGVNNFNMSLVFNTALPSSKVRSVKLTFGIVLSFIFAWTPYFTMLYMVIFEGFNDPVVMVFIPTYYLNCSVNPIIFFVFHRRIRRAKTVGSSSCGLTTETTVNRLSNNDISTTVKTVGDTEISPLKQSTNC
ncbi:gonadotropin-releasing hormone receptor-like [Ruditapes philippinarum]|uniref:gonadotropin-releasing hormone receptor-like n=1 Tax=Ruditapes philippinarum TaxID=129788 RepID=UPI00295B47A8|nr:gonadotropin-releasing hormone receptor-like [Ruditapes philippinarum]